MKITEINYWQQQVNLWENIINELERNKMIVPDFYRKNLTLAKASLKGWRAAK